jgi:hypothetical protein
MGQSIGLHVEISQWGYTKEMTPQLREQRRRVWYSLYALDRLLALQLGRPFAIHEVDFAVQLPSREENASASVSSTDEKVTPSHMDYFLCLIQFSHIVGRVVTELYRPTQTDPPSKEILLSTTTLDWDLAQWKEHLPRHLRFDLGHTLEKSVVFRRQVRGSATRMTQD